MVWHTSCSCFLHWLLSAFHAPKKELHYTCMTLRTTCIILTFLAKLPRNPKTLGSYTCTFIIENLMPSFTIM
jgi:hypothetical protein